jgi:hypothetical protein
MAKEMVLQLRYLGVLPQTGFREYRFEIESHDKTIRMVALTIDDVNFRNNRLMFQEAPDLCYQKLLAELSSESMGTGISSRATVTESEIASYRDSHPNTKSRRSSVRRPD